MMTRMAKALATATVAAGLVAGVAFGGGIGAREDAPGGSGIAHEMAAGTWVQEGAVDTDPPIGWRGTADATPAVVAIDVVANYCSPTACRPRTVGAAPAVVAVDVVANYCAPIPCRPR